MAEYRFDCRKCKNTEFVQEYGANYCIPIMNGEKTIELHDMGGTKKGDYLTCEKYEPIERI